MLLELGKNGRATRGLGWGAGGEGAVRVQVQGGARPLHFDGTPQEIRAQITLSETQTQVYSGIEAF